MNKKRRRHTAEQIIKKLRDADAMLAADKSVGEVLQALEVSEATLSRWRSQSGGMKSEEAKRLKALEEESNRLKKIVADQALDISMLKLVNDRLCVFSCYKKIRGRNRQDDRQAIVKMRFLHFV